jgi:hypothetical protein
MTIPFAKGADLDAGMQRDFTDSRADILFFGYTDGYAVAPRSPAQIAVASSPATSPDQCAIQQLRTDYILLNQLHIHSALCVKTKSNRYSAITLTGISGLNTRAAAITIHYTTWV